MSESAGRTSSSSFVWGGLSILAVIVVFVVLWEGYKFIWTALEWTEPVNPSDRTLPHTWDIVGALFRTGDGHVYGDNVGGYARNELATLYLTEKLSLSPANLFMINPSLSVSMAVIRNVHGQPVMTEPSPQDGAETLIADPAFHA